MHYVTSMVNIDITSKVPQRQGRPSLYRYTEERYNPIFRLGGGVGGKLNSPTHEATPHLAKLASGSEFPGDVGIPAYPLCIN